MANNLHTNNSLISLYKKNTMLRYVTIKAGWNNSEIYIFKYRKNTATEGSGHNFWYGFITPEETVIVLGSATGRKTMNYAYCAVYLDQEKATRLNPPALFIIAVAGDPAQSYFLDTMAENGEK